MALVTVARKTRLIDSEEDVCNLLFNNPKSAKSCRLFLEWLKQNGQEASRHEVSLFGSKLGEGMIEKGFRYSRKNLYKTVLKRLVDLGLIGLRARSFKPFARDKKKHYIEKYVPVIQPIPFRSPSGQNFWHLSWHLCRKWNSEWERSKPSIPLLSTPEKQTRPNES